MITVRIARSGIALFVACSTSCSDPAACRSDFDENAVSSQVEVRVTPSGSGVFAEFARNGEFQRQGAPQSFGACSVFAFNALSDADPGRVHVTMPAEQFELSPNTMIGPPSALPEYIANGIHPLGAGDVVRFETTGGDVAPFAVSIRVPPLVSISLPPALVSGIWSASMPAQITWTATDGQVFVWLLNSPSVYDQFRVIECFFDARTGMGVIPAEAFASFGVGAAELFAGSSCRTSVRAGAQIVRAIARHAQDRTSAVRFQITP